MTATKEKFYKVYVNLPLGLREEVIIVIDNQPLSWKVAKMEIDNGTKLSEKILGKLRALKLI